MSLADKLQDLVGNQYEGSREATFTFDDATNTYHFNCGSIWYHGKSIAELFERLERA